MLTFKLPEKNFSPLNGNLKIKTWALQDITKGTIQLPMPFVW